jgi:hypothetical protein
MMPSAVRNPETTHSNRPDPRGKPGSRPSKTTACSPSSPNPGAAWSRSNLGRARLPRWSARRRPQRSPSLRGTGSSNPSPSSRQSVSRPHPLSNVENPGFPRGCARLASRPGRQRRAGCFDIARTGSNISVGPDSSMFSPLAIMAGKVGILANGPAMSLLRGTEGSIRLPPAGRQVRNPTRHPP